MGSKPKFKRRQFFIKKKFQTNFFLKFFFLILLEVAFAIGIFAFISSGTITTGYMGSELRVESTMDFFLSTFSLLNFIAALLIGLTGVLVFILITHKIAGPLFHFEKVLKEIGKGDLSRRCHLREADQLVELAGSLNQFASTIDRQMGEVKSNLSEALDFFNEVKGAVTSGRQDKKNLEASLNKLSEKLHKLQNSTDYFKVSTS